jgi:hypothetical protein
LNAETYVGLQIYTVSNSCALVGLTEIYDKMHVTYNIKNSAYKLSSLRIFPVDTVPHVTPKIIVKRGRGGGGGEIWLPRRPDQ